MCNTRRVSFGSLGVEKPLENLNSAFLHYYSLLCKVRCEEQNRKAGLKPITQFRAKNKKARSIREDEVEAHVEQLGMGDLCTGVFQILMQAHHHFTGVMVGGI